MKGEGISLDEVSELKKQFPLQTRRLWRIEYRLQQCNTKTSTYRNESIARQMNTKRMNLMENIFLISMKSFVECQFLTQIQANNSF